ncbi:MAG: hypothetical protein H0X66_13845 [Verrucomicrobia bacterium]|nr:hypothetical protein [Verrucomicrobiota bacterium]
MMPQLAKSSNLNLKSPFHWLWTGDQALGEMLDAIDAAQHSVRLEMYIFHQSPIGEDFLRALVTASNRGVRVKVMLDALGSMLLPESFWAALKENGGELRWFNPLNMSRFGFRDHRKILVCDQKVAFIGGFNIATEYLGDGVNTGWRDLGMKIYGPLVEELSEAFDQMFSIADFRQKRFSRLRRSRQQRLVKTDEAELLLSAPGRQRNPIKKAIIADLKKAKRVQIICAYFLPTWNLRRELTAVARRGGQVQLILPGKSDVPLSQAASRSLYRRVMQSGVEIYEYGPQILHAKLIIVDDIVYAGSANLDMRSLHLNYELLVRIADADLAAEARKIFTKDLTHSVRIDPDEWRASRTYWIRLRQRWAYFILARLDPLITRHQIRQLR